MKIFTFFAFFLFSITAFAQIKGKITDKNQVPLSFVSIYLDKTVTGTTSNDNGEYILNIKNKGKQTVVFQFLGYKTIKKEINIDSFPYQLDIILEEESVTLSEISISTKDNPAKKIVKKVIDNKDKNTNKYANYTAKFYSRGLTRIKNAPEKFFGQSTGDFGGGLDSTRTGIIYLSETFSNISYQKKPKKFKEFIVASKVSGQDNGVSFNRAEDSKIDIYENSIAIFNDLVSPISTNAFSYYNYKLVGTFYDNNGKLINKIELLPKRKNDRVFNGFIYVVEDDWALYGVDLTTTGAQVNLPLVNSLKLKQGFTYSQEIQGWIIISQSIDFDISIFGFKPSGKFSYVYSNYKFKPNFTKETFTNEVLAFEENATKKDTFFWNKLRPVPLTKEEIKDYKVKDSIKILKKSKKYLDSVDAKENKFEWLDPLTGYTFQNSYDNRSFSYNGPLFKTSFNTVQGLNTSLGFNYFEQINKKGKWWSAGADFSYGFSEKRFRPTFYFVKKWNNLSKPRLAISGGVTAVQFNDRIPITRLDNLIRSLTKRENYLKLYEKEFVKIGYSEEIKNGIYFSSSLEYANRKPLFNTSNYSFVGESENVSYTSNNPLDPTDFNNAAFTTHAIATLNLGATFIFGQKYLSYPDRKENAGNSKFPRLDLKYRKRFGASNKDLNSDLFVANLKQDINTGNYGEFSYNFRGGIFLEKKNIAFMDNLQANGNQLLFVTGSKSLSTFNLLEYYNYFTNDRYAEAHIQHNFRGAVLGKIPLINKLNFHLVIGGKALFMANRNPYTEYTAGLSNLGFGKWRFFKLEYVSARYSGIKENGFVIKLNLF